MSLCLPLAVPREKNHEPGILREHARDMKVTPVYVRKSGTNI